MIRNYFVVKTEYGQDERLFENRKNKLEALREEYKEYAKISGLPEYKAGDILIMAEENVYGSDAEGCLFGKIDYSRTTYSIKVKATAWFGNDKEAKHWKEKFEEVSSRYEEAD